VNSNHKLRIWLLRYTPNPLLDASITIAVLVQEDGTGKFSAVRFIADWDSILAFDPFADLEFLDKLKNYIEESWTDSNQRQRILHQMEDTFSNTLQITHSAVVTNEIEPEIERIVDLNLRRAAYSELGVRHECIS
jgi:hypothetical protein